MSSLQILSINSNLFQTLTLSIQQSLISKIKVFYFASCCSFHHVVPSNLPKSLHNIFKLKKNHDNNNNNNNKKVKVMFGYDENTSRHNYIVCWVPEK